MRHLVLLLIAGCTIRNPAFDDPIDLTAADTTTTGASPTTTPSADTTSSSASDATATATSDTATSTPPTDTTTTALCVNPCGPCHTCEDGECIPTPGTPCHDPKGEPCETLLAGVTAVGDNATCNTYAPSPPTCDAAGECTYTCSGLVPLHACGLRCVRDDNPCIAGEPAGGVDIGSFCVFGTSTEACKVGCTEQDGHHTHMNRWCDLAGSCVELFSGDSDCGNYVCEVNCLAVCVVDANCADGFHCVLGQCVAE